MYKRQAKESKIIDNNPTIYLTAKGGGIPQKDKAVLTDEQAARLLDASHGRPPYVFVMLGPVSYTHLLAFFDWRMALAIFCTMPVTFLIILGGRKLQLQLCDKQVDVNLEASSQIQEYLEVIKIIKSCGLGGSRFDALNKALQAMRKIAMKVELASGILVQGASLILQAGLGITIFIGTVLITGGKIELLPLLVLLMFSTQIYGPIPVSYTHLWNTGRPFDISAST